MQKHYVIGDIHGEYEMLLSLVAKLPKEARLIFVGDMVNRGKQGCQVIEFVRENAFGVVRGNHEEYMMEHGRVFLEAIENKMDLHNIWLYVGGSPMLQPYHLLNKDHAKSKSSAYSKNKEGIEALKRDLEWIASLPLYLELGEFKNYDKPVVVSHGIIGDYWHLKENNRKEFEFFCTNNRLCASSNSPIFNIHGHVHKSVVERGENFINIDTSCGKLYDGKLSAYCVETEEIFEVTNLSIRCTKTTLN